MADFIYFTEEQKERANSRAIYDILADHHEKVERAGREWRWERHNSITFRGNRWYRHSSEIGGKAISFMQEFFGMTYPEAVTYLLQGETGEVIRGRRHLTQEERKQYQSAEPKPNADWEVGGKVQKADAAEAKEDRSNLKETTKEQNQMQDDAYGVNEDSVQEKKTFKIPARNENMKRVYAYLLKNRFINRDIVSHFAKAGTLYEDGKHHNIIFAGTDKDGSIRHIHRKGTNAEGQNFRINEEGSDPDYGFGHMGSGNRLYVFEAPIDLLSFLTLYSDNWQEQSYITLNGVSQHPMLKALEEHENLDTVILCLDHDSAGIEACGRLAELLIENGYARIRRLSPVYKDWNEDLKHLHGKEALPAEEHPKLLECADWMTAIEKATEIMDAKYATKGIICRYYRDIHNTLKGGKELEQLEEAFDGYGLLITVALVRMMEQAGKSLGRNTSAKDIIENIGKRYQPHRDKGNLNTHIRGIQDSFREFVTCFEKSKIEETAPSEKAQTEQMVRKCMGLAMECIKAHIFIATDYKEQLLKRKEIQMSCSQL